MDYDKLIAPAAEAMRPSGIRKFFDLAAEMPECISLGVGEPDFKTPWAVREAGIESLEHGRTRYTSNAGLKELRAEVAKYLERRMGLHYDPLHEVLITVGGSEAIDMCIRTLVQPGDEVIIPEPCFVCYEPSPSLRVVCRCISPPVPRMSSVLRRRSSRQPSPLAPSWSSSRTPITLPVL